MALMSEYMRQQPIAPRPSEASLMRVTAALQALASVTPSRWQVDGGRPLIPQLRAVTAAVEPFLRLGLIKRENFYSSAMLTALEKSRGLCQRILWQLEAGETIDRALIEAGKTSFSETLAAIGDWHGARILNQRRELIKGIAPWARRATLVGALLAGTDKDMPLAKSIIDALPSTAEKAEVNKKIPSYEYDQSVVANPTSDNAQGGPERPNLDPDHLGQSDIQGEGRPGEMDHGAAFGDIQLESNNHLTESLWVTRLATRAGNRFALVHPAIRSQEPRAQAGVTLHFPHVRAGERAALPIPFGYGLNNVFEVAAFTPHHQRLAVQVASGNHELQFSQDADQVDVFYRIAAVREDVPVEETYAPNSILRTAQDHRLIRQIARSERPTPALLPDILHEFTYITSSSLQRLLDAMPGGMEEKAAALRLGDCDVLSMYAAGLLHDAGRPAAVSFGNITNGNRLMSIGHSQLLYRDAEHDWHSYETTSQTRQQFVNVRFLPADWARLTSLTEGMSWHDQNLRLQQYADFRREFERILAQPAYDAFRLHGNILGGLPSSIPETTDSNDRYEAMEHQRQKEFLESMGLAVLLALGLIAAYGRRTRQLRDQAWRQRTDVLNRFIGASLPVDKAAAKRSAGVDDEAINRVLGLELKQLELNSKDEFASNNRYKTPGVLQRLQLPAGDPAAWPKQRRLACAIALLYMRTLDQHDPFNDGSSLLDLTHWQRQLAQSPMWQRLLARLEVDGLSREALIDELRQTTQDPKRRETWQRQAPEEAMMLMAEAGKIATSIIKTEPKNVGDAARLRQHAFQVIAKERTWEDMEASTAKQQVDQGDYAGHRPYAPGDSLRALDQKVFARTRKLMIREAMTAEGEARDPQAKHLVIDLMNASVNDLRCLAALLSYAHKRPSVLRFASCTALAYGKVCQRWTERELRLIVQAPTIDGRKSLLQSFLERLQQLSLQQHVFPPSPYPTKKFNPFHTWTTRYWNAHRSYWFDQPLGALLDADAVPADGQALLFGMDPTTKIPNAARGSVRFIRPDESRF